MKSCCKTKVASKQKNFDYLLWGSLLLVILGYFFGLMGLEITDLISGYTESVVELVHRMWWGVLIGIVFVGMLDRIPRELLVKMLGKGGTFSGLLRAVGAGVLLDLCSHGILLVGMKLYERGASLGQMMAFLIASPWNSLSLTLILWGLIGFKWMMVLLLLSVVIALISGMIFDGLVKKGVLPENPNKAPIKDGVTFGALVKQMWKKRDFSVSSFVGIVTDGTRGSKMILKWILFGIVIASIVRVLLSPESFENYFGPTLAGLGLTLLVATIMEVCSEGATPLAADFTTRAFAPGNTFAFLMTGVSTDYTEILSVKETTKSWKIAWFLPLVTLPQVIAVGWILNQL